MNHSSEDFLCSRQQKYNLKKIHGFILGNQDSGLKWLWNSKKKWKKDLKALTKQKIMVYSTSKKTVPCKEICKINKIRSKANKKYSLSSSYRYINDSDSYLSSDSEWEI